MSDETMNPASREATQVKNTSTAREAVEEEQYRLISHILASDEWTEGEKSVVKWQYRLHGDFKTALWTAIIRADESNLRCLGKGFPDEVAGYMAWAWSEPYSLGKKLRKTGLWI